MGIAETLIVIVFGIIATIIYAITEFKKEIKRREKLEELRKRVERINKC